MKKCRTCGSKKLKQLSSIFVCVKCQEVNSNIPKLDALKKVYFIKEKNRRISAYNEAIEKLQKVRTAENILRRTKEELR